MKQARQYRSVLYLPKKLIRTATDEGWERSLGYYARMKAVYRNGTFYGFSLRRVAEQIGCSPTTLSVHLRTLEAKGLIRHHAGNLTLVGYKKLMELSSSKYGAAMPVRIDHNSQMECLRAALIEMNLVRQQHSLKVKQERCLHRSKNEIASIGYVGLSAAGFARVIGRRSTSTGSRNRNRLIKKGILKGQRVIKSMPGHAVQFEVLKDTKKIPYHARYNQTNKTIYWDCYWRLENIPIGAK